MTAPSETSESVEWLARAVRDLEKASAMSALGAFDPGDVCAYAQQAAEKAIKAALAYGPGAVPRVHDLRELQCRAEAEIAPHVTDEMLVRISAQWVSSRYPGDWAEPTEHDAETALHVARAVVADVTRIVMEQEHEQ
ncbi:MAG: HEPN domain-containing protein [Coriobacteriia bacterium]